MNKHRSDSAWTKSNIVTLVSLTIATFFTLILFIYDHHSQHMNELDKVLQESEIESRKMRINSELMELARSRTRLTSQILHTEDIFEQDELNMKLEGHASQFAQLRSELLSLPLTYEEQHSLIRHDEIVSEILPAQRLAVTYAMGTSESEYINARQILYGVVLPGQQELIQSFSHLINQEQYRIAELTEISTQSLRDMDNRIDSLLTATLLFTLPLSLIVIIRIRHIQQDLRQSYQHLEEVNDSLETRISERTRELNEMNQRLKQASEQDALTGIFNRGKFDAYIIEEYARATRTGSELAIILLDIDSFKAYNDHYGHQEGDRCLTKVAHALSSRLTRATDFIARYGGEEFIIILSSTNLEQAYVVAENLRQAVIELNIPHAHSNTEPHLTISLGIATYKPGDGLSTKELIEQADNNLYTAKYAGRNRIIPTLPESFEHSEIA